MFFAYYICSFQKILLCDISRELKLVLLTDKCSLVFSSNISLGAFCSSCYGYAYKNTVRLMGKICSKILFTTNSSLPKISYESTNRSSFFSYRGKYSFVVQKPYNKFQIRKNTLKFTNSKLIKKGQSS